jgi:heme exporter protein C
MPGTTVNYKKSIWLLLIGAVLVIYTLIGGLLIPLKTGISESKQLKIRSGMEQSTEFELYNPNKELVIQGVYLSKNGKLWASNSTQQLGKQLLANFTLHLGEESSGYADVFVRASFKHKDSFVWMFLANGLWIEKSPTDTITSNALSSSGLLALESTRIIDDKQSGFPNRIVLNESIRNLLYHVPMWFSMMFLMAVSMYYAIKYLRFNRMEDDWMSMSFLHIGILNGILGCITGAIWARVTWQSWWPVDDPKLNGVAIGMFMYFAYLLLRSNIKDVYQKARISSVYNILIFPIFMALIAIMPKLADNSLHPGTGGTVGFNKYDLDNTLRMFFYPAILGWIAIFSFLAVLRYRVERLKQQQIENEIE